MNLPNILTMSRFVLTGGFLLFMQQGVAGALWAMLFFMTAALTDMLDGYFARKWNLITTFGKLMDPVADKFMTLSALLILANEGLAPLWMVIVIALREILVTISRLYRLKKGEVIPAEGMGKMKTIVQMAAIMVALLYRVLWSFPATSTGASLMQSQWEWLIIAFVVFSLMLSLWSGVEYFIGLSKKGGAHE
ncbi:MAG: CDP-diacylglycerol--glycerol-3-phosphate 3-phosphatidyltransferase [Candidatus Omnitrophota bacterium]